MQDEDRLEQIVPDWRTRPERVLKLIDNLQNRIKQYEEDVDGQRYSSVRELRLVLGDVIEYGSDTQVLEAVRQLCESPTLFVIRYQGFGNADRRRKQK